MAAFDTPGAGAPATPIRVLVADDHSLFRSGVSELLEEHGFEVAGDAADGEEAVRRALAVRPDVILMDLRMPRCSGIEATRRLADAAPEIRIIMLTVAADEHSVVEALVAGASGYVLKDAAVDTIVGAIRAAAEGDAVISPPVAARLIDRVRDDAPRQPEPVAVDLSPREIEVLRLLSRGYDNPFIGATLYISTSTVKSHISTILRKLGVRNRIEAAVYAVQHGLI